jgi:DNA-binding response OmpR family regulator
MNKKILVIDDDPPIVKGIEMVLKNAGYSTQVSLRGEETIDLVDSFKPDLILLDVMLGAMDGREIARDLKSKDKTKHIPIVMISANHTMEKGITSYGVDTFVPKPFSSALLLETIKKYCHD